MALPLYSEEEQYVSCDLQWSEQALSFRWNRGRQNENMPPHKSAQNMPRNWDAGQFWPQICRPPLPCLFVCKASLRWSDCSQVFPKYPPFHPLPRVSQSRYIFLAFFQLCQNDSVFDVNKCEKFKSGRSKAWFGFEWRCKAFRKLSSHVYIKAFARQDKVCKCEIYFSSFFFACYVLQVFCCCLVGDTCDSECEGGSILTWVSSLPPAWLLRAKTHPTMKIEMVRYRRAQKRLIAGLRKALRTGSPGSVAFYCTPPSPSTKTEWSCRHLQGLLQIRILGLIFGQDLVSGGAWRAGWRVIAGGWRDGSNLPWRRLQLASKNYSLGPKFKRNRGKGLKGGQWWLLGLFSDIISKYYVLEMISFGRWRATYLLLNIMLKKCPDN